jgi:hypothetical protein
VLADKVLAVQAILAVQVAVVALTLVLLEVVQQTKVLLVAQE